MKHRGTEGTEGSARQKDWLRVRLSLGLGELICFSVFSVPLCFNL